MGVLPAQELFQGKEHDNAEEHVERHHHFARDPFQRMGNEVNEGIAE